MPIFQADLEHLERDSRPPDSSLDQRHQFLSPNPASSDPPAASASSPQQLTFQPLLPRRLSEESIRTDLCEGPVPDSPQPAPQDADMDAATSDRAELIERLKRGESPTWIPNRHLESLFNTRPSPPRPTSRSSNLLPPADITPEKLVASRPADDDDEERLQQGLSIQRPRSALHSGDFTQDQERHAGFGGRDTPEPRVDGHREMSNPWLATSPPRHFSPFHFDQRASHTPAQLDYRSTPSSLSSSLSSSFVYRPPTSPLVQSESNEELDVVMPVCTPDRDFNSFIHRRHTSYTSQSPFSFSPRPSPVGRQVSMRRENTFPYQAHQPRRSLTTTPNGSLPGPSPSTPAFLRPRRPSFGSESSSIQHASMVGSYEESILRGRMSTTPSKPLDFVAQIGVLGLGRCKASLKCPPHVTLPFPAVFYSYASSSSHGRTLAEDGPSPYVGQIDLENGLPHSNDEHRSRRKMNTRNHERRVTDAEAGDSMSDRHEHDVRRAARKRRSGSPRAPPGGSYRIPEKGQIQIVIKNPNKTAVKLFLVPYDLAGMEPGTKTFVRQRSYSAGPIIEDANVPQDPMADRAILRYLVHLHVCCPSKGRFYLYKSIRIVFANRVPDGKERLRVETTWPEPRFTAYKPIRVMHPPTSAGPGAMLAAEKAYRRRSSGFAIGRSLQAFDPADAVGQSLRAQHHHQHQQHSPSPFSFGGNNNQPIDPVPLRLPQRGRIGSDLSDSTATTGATGIRSPGSSSQASRPTTKDGLEAQIARYEKLSKGDVGYGGNAFAGSGRGSPGPAEGLLSQRLRSLGVQGQGHGTSPPDRSDD
ncbi:hypothetical protein B0T11DRAFT_5714 [Plectosphaerella cucumerina]|uniref:Atos-like conserved domain-containing protein n=1 Tax=Plectosphaerella cucumerina TaxID=40658 RepID=A0A8K0TNF5_9PEZI|nr:hypothetical protein B0T11DRAFT_5714 [Plectosphaerella cucumerina]